MKPYLPFHVKIIMNSMKNKREIYEAMSDFEADQPGNKIKWNSEFLEQNKIVKIGNMCTMHALIP